MKIQKLIEPTGIILARQQSSEHFRIFFLLSPQYGHLKCLVPLKGRNFLSQPDLFNELTLTLTPSKKSNTLFAQKFHLIATHQAIAKHYNCLINAQKLCDFLHRNIPPQYASAHIYTTLKTFLKALEKNHLPHTTLFKALFKITQTEGYPVQEAWLPQLPPTQQQQANTLLKTPLQLLPPQAEKNAHTLLQTLKHYLVHSLEFSLP